MNFLLLGLATLAALVCCGITAKSVGLARLPGCSEKSSCDEVASSRWSHWVCLPVASMAMAVYLTLAVVLGICGFIYQDRGAPLLLHRITIILVLLILGATVWFLVLEVAVVRKTCLYCNMVHCLGLATAIIWFATSAHRHEVLREAVPLALASGSGLLLLVAGQVFWKPRDYAILPSKIVCRSNAGDLNSSFREAWRIEAAAVKLGNGTAQDMVSLLSGEIHLDAGAYPSVGPNEARRCVALVFDYTCTSCRRLHRFVDELVEVGGDTRAIFLPVPKNPACNPEVKEVRPGRGQACQYARLAIGVWKKRPDQYLHFSRYLCAAEDLPPLGLARERAEELVGASIDPYLPDEQIEAVISASVRVYQKVEIEKIPVLLLRNSSFVGKVGSFAEFKALIEPLMLDDQLQPAGTY